MACPEKTALCIIGKDDTEEWSYSDLRAAILGTATGFLDCGARPGSKILMRLGNTVDFPIAYLAALAVGCVPVPTSAALTEVEVDDIVRTLRPELTLHDPLVPCPDMAESVPLDVLRQFRQLPAADIHIGSADRLGYIVYTSGTSGVPRAVGHAHRAIWARRMMFDGWYGLTSRDRVMHAGAFNWTYTLGTGLMDPWTIGATALIPTAGTRPVALPELMARHGATIFAAAPGVFRQMLANVEHLELTELRHGLSAGEKLPAATAQKWREASQTPVFEAYGMSECSTFISHGPNKQGPQDTLGCPQQGRKVALLKDGAPVERGKEGTIAVHHSDPGLMIEYIGAPEETESRFCNGWFLTGDQGSMDADGFITSLGRNDDMMNAGGFRVSPIEVENALVGLPGVVSVAVTEVTVKDGASVIAAFYTGPVPLDETTWHRYVSGKLARYKQPRMFVHLDTLPMGANGKILRRALREQYESHHDRRNQTRHYI